MRVLFVCLGNICRSPTAEGVFRAAVERSEWAGRVEVDSAGCAGYHTGDPPDPRSQQAAKNRGIDLSEQRARQVRPDDFGHFDYILCADFQNLADLEEVRDRYEATGASSKAKLDLFLRQAKIETEEIPDPYYGGPRGFDHVLDLCERASLELLASWAPPTS